MRNLRILIQDRRIAELSEEKERLNELLDDKRLVNFHTEFDVKI